MVNVASVNQAKLGNHPQQHFLYRKPIVLWGQSVAPALRVQLRSARERAI